MKKALSKVGAIHDSHTKQNPKKRRQYKARASGGGGGAGVDRDWEEKDASDVSSDEDSAGPKKPKLKKQFKEIKITHEYSSTSANPFQSSSQTPDSGLSQESSFFSPPIGTSRSSDKDKPEETMKAKHASNLSILEKTNILLERMMKLHPEGTEHHEKYKELFEKNVLDQIEIMGLMHI